MKNSFLFLRPIISRKKKKYRSLKCSLLCKRFGTYIITKKLVSNTLLVEESNKVFEIYVIIMNCISGFYDQFI
ncbi:hypothetical protein J2S15_003830 [Breznakia pachnodae]|uniref:Uncharacterized protein n=1 Tax=Breznakia pachnodae TaxID=265178 RepID=A0ABU0E848_9FIRM|nr:hypothetical protein [Breznakia pachnodae]